MQLRFTRSASDRISGGVVADEAKLQPFQVWWLE